MGGSVDPCLLPSAGESASSGDETNAKTQSSQASTHVIFGAQTFEQRPSFTGAQTFIETNPHKTNPKYLTLNPQQGLVALGAQTFIKALTRAWLLLDCHALEDSSRAACLTRDCS